MKMSMQTSLLRRISFKKTRMSSRRKEMACIPISIGWFNTPKEERHNKRLIKMQCYYGGGTANCYMRPIEGSNVVVMDLKKVIEYIEHDKVSLSKAEGNLEEAFSLVGKMKRQGVAPTRITYNSILAGLCKQKQVEQVGKILSKMVEGRCGPDTCTYNILIRAHFVIRDIEKVCKILSAMALMGYTPNVVTYNTIITGLCKLGDTIGAFTLFEAMQKKGIAPDKCTYSILTGHLCRGLRVYRAWLLLDEMIAKGVKPTSAMFKILIEGFQKSEQFKEADRLAQQMKKLH